MKIDKELPKINGDYSWLTYTYSNLISNAIKFIDKDGQITITVKEKDDFISSLVSDNGTKIPKEGHKKIFEKFYHVNSSNMPIVGRMGFGFYTIKTIIELHGGKICGGSEDGKGGKFSFSLPKWNRKDA